MAKRQEAMKRTEDRCDHRRPGKSEKDVEILSAQAIEDLNKLPGNNEFLENLIRILIKRQK